MQFAWDDDPLGEWGVKAFHVLNVVREVSFPVVLSHARPAGRPTWRQREPALASRYVQYNHGFSHPSLRPAPTAKDTPKGKEKEKGRCLWAIV